MAGLSGKMLIVQHKISGHIRACQMGAPRRN